MSNHSPLSRYLSTPVRRGEYLKWIAELNRNFLFNPITDDGHNHSLAGETSRRGRHVLNCRNLKTVYRNDHVAHKDVGAESWRSLHDCANYDPGVFLQ